MNKALFLDRDGVINVDHGYVGHYADFQYIDGIFALIRRYQDSGFVPVIVTNQSGIARGYYTESDFCLLMERVQQDFSEHGIHQVRVYHCPHHEQGSVAQFARPCDCRKPAPGMLIKAQQELNIDVARSVMIGDSWRDIVAADAAGVRRSFYLTNNSITQEMLKELDEKHSVNQVATLAEIRDVEEGR
jgi:D-glycero-D-manno-heptose 1,7-bisphosphate phosphatase